MEDIKRERLAGKLQSKMGRVSSLVEQREALIREVRAVQAAIGVQEERMRGALRKMEVRGRGTRGACEAFVVPLCRARRAQGGRRDGCAPVTRHPNPQPPKQNS